MASKNITEKKYRRILGYTGLYSLVFLGISNASKTVDIVFPGILSGILPVVVNLVVTMFAVKWILKQIKEV